MKFMISRTSVWEPTEPPVEGAVLEEVVKTQRGTWSSLEAARADNGKGWFFRYGTFNHRQDGSGVAHDYRDHQYVLEVGSLEQLVALVEREGRIVIESGDHPMPTIEVYDDYRE